MKENYMKLTEGGFGHGIRQCQPWDMTFIREVYSKNKKTVKFLLAYD
jgi:hypothetical protein